MNNTTKYRAAKRYALSLCRWQFDEGISVACRHLANASEAQPATALLPFRLVAAVLTGRFDFQYAWDYVLYSHSPKFCFVVELGARITGERVVV